MKRNRSAKRTDPALWEAVKAEVTAGSKGGRPGQWSARKAQMSVRLYKERGGGYLGPKDPDNSLTKWTKQKWRTKSGRSSLETGERYLPSDAIDALTDEEYAETTRAKRRGTRKGKQFVKQPKKIARKVKRFRRNTDEPRPVPISVLPTYLYHATHLGKVGDIAEDGLVPSEGSQFSGGYDFHSRGRVFFSGKTGVPYWFDKMEQTAEYNSDFKDTENVGYWTPAVLRIATQYRSPFYTDELGERDSRRPAFFTTEAIEPEGIYIWDGDSWVSVENADIEVMMEHAERAAEYEYDDDEYDGWYNPNFNLFAPKGV